MPDKELEKFYKRGHKNLADIKDTFYSLRNSYYELLQTYEALKEENINLKLSIATFKERLKELGK